uniref:Dynein-1, subspecies f n=1 Tax=Tetradesmus obliquus TaxID=3088 RepID=A0A383W4S5_TETOB|eukprot:jgi/Sobl393_1/1494/SZX72220.1
MAVDANDARLQYIQNLASSTLNISRDSLGPLLACQEVAASLQQFFDGEGAGETDASSLLTDAQTEQPAASSSDGTTQQAEEAHDSSHEPQQQQQQQAADDAVQQSPAEQQEADGQDIQQGQQSPQGPQEQQQGQLQEQQQPHEQQQQQKQPLEHPVGLKLFLGHVPAEHAGCRTFYCVRSCPGPMPDEGLAELLDCGVLTQAPSLRSLEQVLSEVFLPLLSKQVGTADPAGVGALPLGTAAGSAGTSSGRPRELLGNMQKYLAHIKHALQQLTGDVALPMPAVTITSVAAACKDPDVIHTFEETVAEWSSTLSDVMQRESEKRPQGKGPLAEIDFWRARSAVLSGLWEQLSMRAAADIIEVVEAGSDDRNLMAAFKGQMAELGKLVHEARDNVKFLTTLERHFRSVSSGPLAGILDTLPPLMNALRMVWIISRHYSDDARMGALFARIATELSDRVDGAVMLHQLFRMPAAEAIELLRVSKAVLESWQSTYMQVREKIETSGRDARWEFSKATLFARSNYMAEVCGHLSEMVEIVDDFFKFLGPELKAVTGDTKGIDDVIEHVQLMVEPVETAMFDVFDQVHAPQWKALRAHFYADNEKVKAATRELIDTSFRKLRSAEGAFELLQNFKSIKSRGAIQQQMMNKLVDILEQFLREIIAAQEMFDRSKGNPPLTRNQPPVAGAIHWSHQLFSRVKLTMSKLTAVEPEGSWRQMPVGQQVHERYMALAKQMMEFEKQWFQGWRENVDNIAMRHLKQPIFARQPETGVVVVNFHPKLRVLMSEAHYLDRKGFNIPPLALQVALQEDEYRAWTERLEWLLELYYKVTGALSPVEASLLSTRLQDLERCLEPGLVRLNWNNRGIDAFVASTSKAIQEFQGLHHSVQKNSAIVEKLVSGLAAAKLVADLPESADVMELQEFYEYMEQHRAAVVESAVQRYRSLTPLLGKVEELVAGSNTGKSPQLAGYYSYWEMAVFNALVLMVLRALEKLHAMLSSAKKPLFKLKTSLQNSEVAIAPPVKEVSKLLSAYIKNVAESCREFVRWMDGTCLEMPDQRAKGDTDGDPVVMHFSSEVLRMQQVMGAAVQIHQDINKVAARLNRHVEGWLKYSDIWKSDRAQVLDKFKAKAPALSAFEERFARFQKQANLFWGLAHDVDVGCVSVCNSALALAVHEECCSWTRALAAAMRELDVAAMNGVRERMAADHAALQQQPEDLEQLKGVLHVVNSIRSGGMQMELQCSDLQERYRTRLLYAITEAEQAVAAAELADAARLSQEWAALCAAAEAVDVQLDGVKRKFSLTTRQQVAVFAALTAELEARMRSEGPGLPTVQLAAGLESLKVFQGEVEGLAKQREQLRLAEQLFDMDITSYPLLSKVESELRKLAQVYAVYAEHAEAVRQYSNMLWSELDIGNMMNGVQAVATKLKKLKGLEDMPVFGLVQAEIAGFADSLPLMKELKSESLRPRHWKQLMALTGQSFDLDPKTFTLANMFAMQLHKYKEDIAKVTSSALKELTIENELKKLAESWKEQRFDLHKYTANGADRGWVLKGVEEVTLLLEDMGLNLQSMMASPHVRPFADEVRLWEQRLSLIGECIEVWMLVQRKWMYLESIFIGSDDIRNQLPQEAKRFDTIDKAWLKIMADTAKNTNVLDACSIDGRLDQLRTLSEQLEVCQKSLSEYLDTKRCAFPRFYFISDDELLAILGTSDPTSVQEHMLKLFDNCAALKFGRGNKSIVGMTSSEGEGFAFRSQVPVEGAVEVWMTGVEAEMRRTLAVVMKEGVWNYARTPRAKWIVDCLGMVTLAGSQVWWTWETEDSFRRVREGDKHAMRTYAAKLTDQLSQLTGMVRKELTPDTHRKVNTLIITDVHGRDIIDTFVRDSIMDAREFAWESQLRFYWDKAMDDLSIRQCGGMFRYGYEYMGLNGRLVITALTDRCYMTLTTAMTYRLGGAPAGPAGTGKTETVKDLAKAMGVQCVVFNCGEGLDYKAMGSIFSGLVQCGAWGCFDEFNRIEAEVLSVVSSQIKQIQEALKNDLTRFQFEGREIRLDPRAGIFITMNPGYAGRTELPDNLKALFRPVTMVVPDMEQICEIMLFSEGFDSAKVLAKKMTVLYKLAREQLSKQHHYDFGLRALKSVLVMAGALKRGAPDMSEALVLMRALRDSNLPKFVYDDVPLFLGLVGDLFPGMDCPRVRYPQFNDQVEAELAAAGYQVLAGAGDQVDKVVQLYEVLMTRHTVMVVGQTGGGKSVILSTLARAQTAMGRRTALHVLNPKAITVAELYGVLDKDTRDWTDGLLSNIFREVNRPLPPERDEAHYIVFDGDVDAVWVENMNSVMDDNKLLTLPNGERIRLQPHVKLLFEVADLQYASPATISRCGMVYVDSRNLGYKPYFWRWLNMRSRPGEAEALQLLIDKYAVPAIEWVAEGLDGHDLVKRPQQSVPHTNLNMAAQLCKLLDATIIDHPKMQDPQVLDALFVFCCVWSIGALLVQRPEAKERDRFDALMKQLAALGTVDADRVSCSQLPSRSLYEYCFDVADGCWRSWRSYVTEYVPPVSGQFSKILVSTADTVRTSWLLRTVVGSGSPCLLIGESGTSKSVTISNFLASLDAAASISLNMNFSSRTSSLDVQRAIEDSTEKRTKDSYGPPMGKRLLMFVDDMNMPRVDTYGTQQPIALLKMFVERKGFYDRGKELSWKNIKDVQLVAAMGPPGGARNAVDPRFISLFSAFEVQPPSNDNLRTIYQAMLSKHLARLNNSDITQMVGDSLTDITLELYNAVLEKLPPTPSRFHYVFNLRDLSRVYEGLLRSCSDVVQEPWQFLRLWRNEVLRVFHDRLISPEDKTVLQDKVAELVQRRYAVTSDKVMADPILFGDYRNVLADPDTAPGGAVLRLYEDVGSYSSIQPLFESVLAAYNQKHKPMQLVFFDDALEHLTRIQRTLRLPLGHCLLVGVGGSGKQSLARLAAYSAGCGVFEICLTRGYDEAAFREDLKKLYGMLGAEDKRMVFLFTDSHVADEGFLELINNMLTSGMVPALYDDAEKEGLVSSIRSELTAKGLPDSKEACWAAYVEKCRANLHVVLAMSPVGEALRSRCRNFPGLVNNTVIDWFEPWPEQALSSVATAFLESEDLPANLRPSIVEHMVLVHQSVRRFSTQFAEELRRHNYVTPKNYLDFITNYKTSLAGQRKEITDTSSRLSNGLAKLVQASAEVDVLQKELSQAKVVVEAATQECNQLLEVISVNTADAETKQKSAQEKEAALQVESLQIAQDKEEAEQALSEAIPALEEAAAALNDLKRDDITEIRSFAKPHVLVQRVCECVVILKNLKDVSWAGAKSMMTDPGFLKSLVEFDKDGLTEKQVKRVKTEYMKDPSFTYDNIRNISTAGAGLLKWVLAMVNYYNVAKGVEPKRKKVAEAEKNLRLAQKDLADTKDQLAALNAQLTSLRSQFADKTAEQQDLRAKADLMERRLLAAERLIAGLGSEKERWAADIKALEAAREQLVGDCLLCSSFLSYTGAFTYKYRSSMVYGLWQSDLLSRKVPLSQPFKLESIMTNDVEVAAWASEGLPGDELSVQNGLLTTRAARWPLCIDPQMQAVAWIKRREGKQLEGKVKTFHDPDFLKQLELAIQYGFPFLFEGCDEYIDPVIDPVLERSTALSATGKRVIQLGDKEVEWDPNFRLYLTSKLSNPHYGPEVSSKTSIINYGLTQQGLAEQLLGVTVAHERADLEVARAGLVADMSTNKALLKKLEDTLLRELSNATGNILDNQELISTLESAKEKAVEISQKLAAAKVTAHEIEEARVRYSPVAVRGAVLFFVMASLSAVNNMYEYSLGAFLKVFNQSLASSKREASLDGRLRSIIDTLTADVYGYTCLGLFEKHKLMFSFQMAVKILEAGPTPLDPQFLDFFLRGNLSLEKHPRRKPHDWLPVQGWQDLMRLAELAAAKQTPGGGQHVLCGVADDITADEAAWQTYYEREAPETAPLPNGYSSKLSQFEVLLLLRCLRVDRVTVAITHFVMATLGERFVTPPVLDYNEIFKQSSETTPVVFVLSPGADPAFDVFRLGEELGFKPGGKLKYMALGQGMGPKAAELIEAGAARGLWVMLQNCHLLPRWLKTLEKILERLQKPHKDFRLWLTSEPTDKFPLGVLQRSLKVVTEPPNGLKLNLRQSYSKISEELLADCRHPAFRPLVYVLGFFHAVVQERRKYGKLGWNVPYDFNETDFRISLALINTYLGKALGSGSSSSGSEDAIPWATLRYLIGEAMYGGRVSDSFDRRVLTTYLEEYLGDFLFDTFQPFHFYTARDGSSIDVPPAAPREVYIKAIEALPLVQSPEVFGLHANADISYYTSDTRTLWANLVDLQPRVGAAAGAMSREEFVAGIVRDISAKIPEQFDLPLLAKGLGVPSPTQVVLLQELARWNGVLEAMASSLQDLQRALSGEIGFSASLEELSTALYNGKLPPAWARLNPATEKPLGPWMTWFSRRQQQYKSWAEEGEPKVMWLAGLHAPETYLAALVQTACRDRGWPLDRSTLYSQVTRFTDPAQVQEKPTHGCYVSGLYLEGAAWDTATGQLTRQAPRQLVDELPLLQIIPVEASRLKLAGTFRAPVYVTQARRNAMGVGLVFEADLASEMHASHWVLQGVALVLNIDR